MIYSDVDIFVNCNWVTNKIRVLCVLQCTVDIWCIYSAILLCYNIFYQCEYIIFSQVLNTGVPS